MKQVTSLAASRSRRLGVAEAKSRLSGILRHAADGPTIIHSRGRDVAVVLAVADYDRLTAGREGGAGGADFLDRVEALKRRNQGGVDDFVPDRVSLQIAEPFARRVGKRS